MKTILVPTDFSNAAMNAAEYAVSFAAAINANVLLLHAYHLPMALAGDVPVVLTTPEELKRDFEKSLKKEVRRLKKKTNVAIAYKAKLGLAVDEIVEEEKNADFIIMGMTGAGKWSEVLGSVTTATLKKVKTPVIIVPERIGYKKPKGIVLASDYDPSTNVHALDALSELSKAFESKIYVVNVKKQKREAVSVESSIAELMLETQLKDSEHFYYFPEHEDLVEGINEFVKTKKADMIVVVPHRYTLIDRLFHKSFSKKMAFHTQVPLLVLPDNPVKPNTVFF